MELFYSLFESKWYQFLDEDATLKINEVFKISSSEEIVLWNVNQHTNSSVHHLSLLL